MAIRTRRLFAVKGVVGTGATVGPEYTVPVGMRTVIRSVTVEIDADVNATIRVRWGPSFAGQHTMLYRFEFLVGQPRMQILRPWTVMEAGETLWYSGTNGVTISTLAVDGVEMPL